MKTYGQHIRKNEQGIFELSPNDYVRFYESEIHPYSVINPGNEETPYKIYDGITADEFLDVKYTYKEYIEDVQNIINKVEEKKKNGKTEIVMKNYLELSDLQNKLESEGKQVCMFNMLVLSRFLVAKAKTRFVILLKPSIEDVISQLNNVTKISFTNENGNTIDLDDEVLIKTAIQAIEKVKYNDMGVHKIEKLVTWDKVSNASFINSHFVHDMTLFLHNYFNVPRKKNALISPNEVNLILLFMNLLGLTDGKLTNKRYFHFMKIYKEMNDEIPDIGKIVIEGKEYYIPIFVIPYSKWCGNKIDWNDKEIKIKEGEIKVGDTFKI